MAKMRKLRRSYDLLSFKWGIVWVAEVLRCSSPVIAYRVSLTTGTEFAFVTPAAAAIHGPELDQQAGDRNLAPFHPRFGGELGHKCQTITARHEDAFAWSRVTVDHVPAGLLLHVLEDTLTAGRDEFILADQPIFIGIDDCQYRF